MTDLAHYGVPGMKWGRRKNTSAVGSENSRRKKVLTGIAVGVGVAAIGTGVYFVSKKYGVNISKISKSAPQLIQGKKLITSELKKNVPKLDPKRDKELIDFLKNTSSRVDADNAAFRAKAKEQLKDAHLLDQNTRGELAAIVRGERDYVNG